jgi:hypothetical protein
MGDDPDEDVGGEVKVPPQHARKRIRRIRGR